MMARTADVVVIGGGIMGCSIAFHLAKRKVGKVVLLEKQGLACGATGKSGAVIRCHYSNEITAKMALLSLRVFENFADAVGYDAGFTRTGLLVLVAPHDRHGLEENVKMQQQVGIKVKMVSAEELKEIAPYVTADANLGACFEEEAGYVDPVKATASFGQRAQDLGAEICEGTPVTGLRKEGERIAAVKTPGGEISTRFVVNAANAWAPQLAKMVGVDVPLFGCRAQIASFRQPVGFAQNHVICADFIHQVYWRPDLATLTHVGSLSPKEAEERCDPDSYNEAADALFVQEAKQSLQARMPPMQRSIVRGGWAGFYDVSPDWHPILSETSVEGFYLACGFSGHGLKFGPIVGQLLSELIVDGKASTLNLTPFRLKRYEDGELIRGRYEYSVLG